MKLKYFEIFSSKGSVFHEANVIENCHVDMAEFFFKDFPIIDLHRFYFRAISGVVPFSLIFNKTFNLSVFTSDMFPGILRLFYL